MSLLPSEVVETLRANYDLELAGSKSLTGGWDVHVDSWLVQSDLGALVVRRDRSLTVASADWLAEVLQTAKRGGVPVAAPLRTRDGGAGAALADHAVTVRHFAEGRRLDRDRLHELAAAGAVLARLHAALRGFKRARPDRSLWDPALWPGHDDPEPLRDPELDCHEAALARDSRFAQTVTHGDYWADNVIWSGGRIASVIDWSESRHDKAVRELARATWEFARRPERDGLDTDRARSFLAAYRDAAGGFEPGTAEALVPLMRHELRLNARYAYWQAAREDDQREREYADGLARAFARLRALDAAPLLR